MNQGEIVALASQVPNLREQIEVLEQKVRRLEEERLAMIEALKGRDETYVKRTNEHEKVTKQLMLEVEKIKQRQSAF